MESGEGGGGGGGGKQRSDRLLGATVEDSGRRGERNALDKTEEEREEGASGLRGGLVDYKKRIKDCKFNR